MGMAITLHAFEKIDCERFYGLSFQCSMQTLSMRIGAVCGARARGKAKTAPHAERGREKKAPKGLD